MVLGWLGTLIWLGIGFLMYLCHVPQGAAEYRWGPLRVMLVLSVAYLQSLILELLSTNSTLSPPFFVQSLIVWDTFFQALFYFPPGF